MKSQLSVKAIQKQYTEDTILILKRKSLQMVICRNVLREREEEESFIFSSFSLSSLLNNKSDTLVASPFLTFLFFCWTATKGSMSGSVSATFLPYFSKIAISLASSSSDIFWISSGISNRSSITIIFPSLWNFLYVILSCIWLKFLRVKGCHRFHYKHRISKTDFGRNIRCFHHK